MHKYLSDITSICDTLMLGAAFWLAYALRAAYSPIQPISAYAPLALFAIVVFLASASISSLYARDRVIFSLSYLTDFLRAFGLFFCIVVAFAFFSKGDFSRALVGMFVLASFVALYASRFALRACFSFASNGDEDILSATDSIKTLTRVSPDPLALLERMRMRSGRGFQDLVKRCMDIAVSLVALPAIACAFPFIYLYIRLDSNGPVVIAQERIGKDGRPFTLYKFRSMRTDAALFAPSPRHEHDPRITRVGRILRKYSIDELPQFWNVLRGDMSIVGPRPEMPFIVERYRPWQNARLRVLPGITGLWQIFGRKDLPLEENLEFDIYYVFNRSFFLDCAIILKTIPHLVFASARGAY